MLLSLQFLQLLCFVLAFHIIKPIKISNKIWRTGFLASSDLEPSSGFKTEEYTSDSLLRCNMIANEKSWAKVMCNNGTKCLLSDKIVLPSFHPQDLADPVTCMTTEFPVGGTSNPTTVDVNTRSSTLTSDESSSSTTTTSAESSTKVVATTQQQKTTSTIELASKTTGLTSTTSAKSATTTPAATTITTLQTDSTTTPAVTTTTTLRTDSTTTPAVTTTTTLQTDSTTTTSDMTTTTSEKTITTSTEKLTTTITTTETTRGTGRPALKEDNFITTTFIDYKTSKNDCKEKNASPFVPKSQEEYQFIKDRFPSTPTIWFPLTDIENEGAKVYEDGTAYEDNTFTPPKWGGFSPNNDNSDCVTCNPQTDVFEWSPCTYTSALPLTCVKNDYTTSR